MTDIITYTPEFIFKYKSSNILTESLRQYLDKIKIKMDSSTDHKEFKVKINKGNNIKLNSTKWYRKRFMTYDEKTKKNINSLLNKLTEKNYRIVTKKILHLKLNSYEIVEYLIKNIIDKCLLESQYILRWSFLIKHIIFNNIKKWTYNGIYIYQIFLNICQIEFEKIIKSNNHNELIQLYKTDIDNFYKKKNRNCSLMLLLGELYKIKIININIIKSIFNELICDINKYYNLEMGIILIKHLISDKEGYKLYENNVRPFLYKKELNKKIKFLIMDIIDSNKKTKPNKKCKTEYISDQYTAQKIKNLINEYIREKDLDYTIGCYNEIKIKSKSNIKIFEFLMNLIDADKDKFNLIFDLLKKLIKHKNIKYNSIKFGLIDFLKEYDDLILDFPNLDKQIIEIFNMFVKIKVLEYNTIKFILNKSMKTDKSDFFLKKFSPNLSK